MSRRAATAADTGAGVKTVAGIVVVAALAVVVLLLVRARPAPEPFDPRSGTADGARGLVLTLEAVGAEVTIARSVEGTAPDDRILVLDDRLGEEQRSELLDAVEAGALVVVADPDSSIHGGAGLDGGAVAITDGQLPDRRLDAELEANLRPGDCDIAALSSLRGLVVPDGLLFPVGPGEPRCFTGPSAGGASAGESTSFVIVRRFGEGTVIGLGDNEPFQNRWLRGADNAALLTELLVPADGAGVTILLGDGAAPTVDDVGSGDDSLGDLVPAWVWWAMSIAALSFVVFAVSRAIRLGRVLDEPVVTPIEGNELVVAAGNLLERSKQSASAGWSLRQRLHHDLCATHGMPLDGPLAELDRVVTDRAGTTPGSIERLLRTETPNDDALVALAHDIRTTRHDVFDDLDRVAEPVCSDTDHREVATP